MHHPRDIFYNGVGKEPPTRVQRDIRPNRDVFNYWGIDPDDARKFLARGEDPRVLSYPQPDPVLRKKFYDEQRKQDYRKLGYSSGLPGKFREDVPTAVSPPGGGGPGGVSGLAPIGSSSAPDLSSAHGRALAFAATKGKPMKAVSSYRPDNEISSTDVYSDLDPQGDFYQVHSDPAHWALQALILQGEGLMEIATNKDGKRTASEIEDARRDLDTTVYHRNRIGNRKAGRKRVVHDTVEDLEWDLGRKTAKILTLKKGKQVSRAVRQNYEKAYKGNAKKRTNAYLLNRIAEGRVKTAQAPERRPLPQEVQDNVYEFMYGRK